MTKQPDDREEVPGYFDLVESAAKKERVKVKANRETKLIQPRRKEKETEAELITQPCASCHRDYKVLRTQGHWRTLCWDCYSVKRDLELETKEAVAKATKIAAQEAAQMVTEVVQEHYRPPTPRRGYQLHAVDSLQGLDLGTAARVALAEAQRDLLTLRDRSEAGDEIAMATLICRIRSRQCDQRRLFMQRVLGQVAAAKRQRSAKRCVPATASSEKRGSANAC
jgi:hypothetical protein